MDKLAAMETFVRVAEAGSFSAAARHLGVGQPAVSKAIAQLESSLGARLLTRSTRRISLTEDGERYLDAARQTLEAAALADQSVAAQTPQGLVRLAASLGFGRLQIVPRLPAFFERYPRVDVDLILSDAFVDLVEEGVDVAIRIGNIADSGLIARRIGNAERLTVGTPDYFDRFGRPQSPTDLAEHRCIVFTPVEMGNMWPFTGPEGPVSVRVCGRLRVNSSDALREALLAGLGIGVTPSWMWRDELMSGQLERVLEHYTVPSRPIQAVFPERRLVSPKVRALVDFLVEEFRSTPLSEPQYRLEH